MSLCRGRTGEKVLRLHPATGARLALDGRRRLTVTCARRRTIVRVRRDRSVGEGELWLGSRALTALGLGSPGALAFRYRASRAPTGLALGPVIGILSTVHAGALPRARDHGFNILNLLHRVDDRGGLVYFFAPEGIDWRKQVIRGYIPGRVQWEEGLFPFPEAIYRRLAIPLVLDQQIRQSMTPRLFNTVGTANKLRQYQALNADPALRSHLPETLPLDTEDTLAAMVHRHGAMYVKNTQRGAGQGIFRVETASGQDGYRVTCRRRHSWRYGRKESSRLLPDFGQLLALVTRLVRKPWNPDYWLVQQRVELARYLGLPFDIRLTCKRTGGGSGRCVAAGPDSARGDVGRHPPGGVPPVGHSAPEDMARPVARD